MGLAKASLEANVRYLAACLGPEGIRVNGLSAGPIKTLAAAGIGGFSKLLNRFERAAPLKRNITIDEVGNVAAFYFSDLSSDHRRNYLRRSDTTLSPSALTKNSGAEVKGQATRFDAVIIGGDTTPVCAAYLARAGLSVCVLERRAVLGGAAVTEEFHPGFRNSTASYTVSLLNPKVIRDLDLARHGLRIVERPVSNFLPLPDNRHLVVGGGIAATQAEFAKFSRRDADALPGYYAMLDRVADVLRDLLVATPPNAGGGVHALLDAWKVAKRFRALDLAGRRDVLDLFTKSAGDVLDRWFESEPVKAVFGFDAVVGNFASPWTPGSAYVLLHHVFGEVNGKRGAWGMRSRNGRHHAGNGKGNAWRVASRYAPRRPLRAWS